MPVAHLRSHLRDYAELLERRRVGGSVTELPSTVADQIEALGGIGASAQSGEAGRLERRRIIAEPEAFPESVAERVRQIAEGGGRIVKRVVDLTDDEIEAIMRARVPPEHDYDYKDDPEPDGEPIHRGSGDFVKDMGYENPDEMRVKFALANDIALAIEERGITESEAAALVGLTDYELSRVARGLVSDCSVDELRRILAALRGSAP